MGGVLRPGQSRAPDRGRPHLAAVPLDVCIRHAGLPRHGGGPPGRRVLLARRVPVRRRRPRPLGRRGQTADRRRLAIPRKRFGPQGLPRTRRARRPTPVPHPQIQGRMHLLEPARLCRRRWLRPAQQSPQAGRAAADDETRGLLAAADPAQPGVGDPARRHRNPQDQDHRIRSPRLGLRWRRPALVLHRRSGRACRRQAGVGEPGRRTHRAARREGLLPNWRQCASAAAN